MAVEVISPGVFTTIQDNGRFGYQSVGIGPGGVMDSDSYFRANELVGNRENEAVLEFTLQGGIYKFQEEAVIALTGAYMDMEIDDEPVPRNMPIQVHPGSQVKIGYARKGMRGYLAVAGGFDVPKVMESRSTNLKCHIGGMDGRQLKAGDEIPIGPCGKKYEDLEKRKLEDISMEDPLFIRVLEGPQDDLFTEAGRKTFYNSEYEVSQESDRMGYRLNGPKIDSIHGTDIVSDGITLGAIQVPSDGKPIILMADHQTTGGYAKIATVISEDISKVAQAAPGTRIRFQKITAEKERKRLWITHLWSPGK